MNNMNAMAAAANMSGGPVGGVPMPMINGPMPPQQAGPRQVQGMDNRALLNTHIYEYFLRNNMYDCARALLSSEQPINVIKDGKKGNMNGLGDDPMDSDSKDDIKSKRLEDLPLPDIPDSVPESCFLYEWFCIFCEMFNAQGGKGGPSLASQYVAHTQQQNRLKQAQQQEMLRNIRPDQLQMIKNISNASMMNKNLARTAMANNHNPNIMMMKQGQMQRDPSNMDGNHQRPSSPGSTENAPSPSKRPRLEGPAGQFPNQQNMMQNGAPQAPGQPVGTGPGSNMSQAHQMLLSNGINPNQLTQQQLHNFASQGSMVQAKSIQTFNQALHQHHGGQMPNKQIPSPEGPQGQGSPMVPQGPAELNAYYNGNMPGDAMRPGVPASTPLGASTHALQDYQMQLMLLEQQNKKRLMMARQEQSDIANCIPRTDGPAGPGGPGPNPPSGVSQPGPNGPGFQDSPQGPRSGASPNPTEMKSRTPQMNNASIPSPLPEGAQSRNSPNAMNFMGNQMDPSSAPHFYNSMDGNRVTNAQIGGAMRPPSSHPGIPGLNGQQLNPQQQQMMAQRQQQVQGQPGAQGGPNAMQWQQRTPNNNHVIPQGAQGPQGPPQGPQHVQTNPQQRSMPPPSAPPAGNNTNARNATASPQQKPPQPPTPQAANKPAPKKKDSKNSKDKKRAAAQKKSASNLNASTAPAAENAPDAEPPTPATPITPVTTGFSAKSNQAAPVPQTIPNGTGVSAAPPAPTAQVAPQPPQDPAQNSFSMEGVQMDFGMDFSNPMGTEGLLQDIDFERFLHDYEQGENTLDLNPMGLSVDGNEISAE